MNIDNAAQALNEKNFPNVKQYVEEGGDIDARDSMDGYTLLLRATEKAVGYAEIIDYLISKGANLELENSTGATALALVTSELMDMGPGMAVSDDVEISDDGSLGNEFLATVLDTLSNNNEEHYIAAARLLLKAGADVTVSNSKDQRPLRVAAVTSAAMVREILAYDKEVDYADEDGFTPLQAAAGQGWGTESIEVLVKAGANVNSIDGYGFTPLHEAILAERAPSVDWLLKLGAKQDIGITQGYSKYTPGDTAMDCAQKLNNPEILDLLSEYA